MKRTQNRPVTISQVASEAGVSSQTVSRVINNRQEISPETRERVQQVIDRLGYQPNAIARSLSRRRSFTLGVVASGLEYFGPSHTLIGIEQGANKMGFSIILSLLHQPETIDVGPIVSGLISRQVEGIIWAVPEISENHSWFKKTISQLAIPVVFNDMRPISALSMVGVDNRSGARKATQHLLEEGYRKIGLLTGPSQWWAGQQRRTGWQDALEETGFSVDPTLIVEGDWSAPSGEQGFYKLIGRRPDIDAVFASNDQMAFGVIRAARRLGIKIPEDLAVVGFDDVPEASFFFPALSTMKQDLFELGSLAVKTLIQILEADNSSETIPAIQPPLLQPELIVRESSTKSTVGKEQYP